MACLLLRILKRRRCNILPLFHVTFAGSVITYSLTRELSKLDDLVPNYNVRGRTFRSTDHSIAQYGSLSKWHETIGATINRVQTKCKVSRKCSPNPHKNSAMRAILDSTWQEIALLQQLRILPTE